MLNTLNDVLNNVDNFIWGMPLIILILFTGILLTVRLRGLQIRHLGKALHYVFHNEDDGEGEVTSFGALCTALSATIGTGNIVGCATAIVAGGPGALFWMWLAAFFGMATKYAEGMLAVKYRVIAEDGHALGGPFYYIEKGMGKNFKWLAKLFCIFGTMVGLFGIGTFTQVNGITSAVNNFFDPSNVHTISLFGMNYSISVVVAGIIVTVCVGLVIIGGIKTISKVSSVVVPVMAIFYVAAGIIVILGNIHNLPAGISMIFKMAFSVKAVGGALCGNIVASMMNAARYGVARGCFSNEAGMGSAAITAAAATTDNPVRQAYINMTGTFWDTIVVCTITGLAIASSGVLGQIDPATGQLYVGSALTIAAFSTVLGKVGGYLVTIGITLFAFSTILGWEYHGEKAFEYLVGTHKLNMVYRIIFSLVAYVGATQTLELVWNFSDIANALMAIPNLICMILLSGEIAKDVKAFQKIIDRER